MNIIALLVLMLLVLFIIKLIEGWIWAIKFNSDVKYKWLSIAISFLSALFYYLTHL